VKLELDEDAGKRARRFSELAAGVRERFTVSPQEV
jgi:hypothetical protein